MCRRINLEVCCEDEPSHAFPHTLGIKNVISLCGAATLEQSLELIPRTTTTTGAQYFPHAYAYDCPSFDQTYVRLERIFWTTCDVCVRRRYGGLADVTEQDLEITCARNRLLYGQLQRALEERPYADLVRAFPAEFEIHRRYVLAGSRWREAPEPAPPPHDPLGPDPPLDAELEGLRWWYEIGMGGAVDQEIWSEFCVLNNMPQEKIYYWLPKVPEAPPRKTPEYFPNPD
ncbi:uncharacterized protein GGS25DRAFT_264405 [Hypoxylon fragiforme]|uniref:uncharacterized protein n=1 Tax=Hypoxylon fragiforme TaxID=63214 RepID=UPI0020C6C717|nr:uncharacterized protein GGS25DRAFT_264405 [Hypoxylon fragiforme]KAI2608191.1 hypothetical protein GGS25DRAFT_264405 [Hypoxylon fragiforme]